MQNIQGAPKNEKKTFFGIFWLFYWLLFSFVRWARIFFSFQKMCFLTRQAAGFSGKTHFLKEKKLWAKWTFSFPEENDRRGLAPYGEGLGRIYTFLDGVWGRHSIFLVPTLFKPFSMLYKIGYTSYLGKCSFIYI